MGIGTFITGTEYGICFRLSLTGPRRHSPKPCVPVQSVRESSWHHFQQHSLLVRDFLCVSVVVLCLVAGLVGGKGMGGSSCVPRFPSC